MLRRLQELAGFLSPGAALPHSCRKLPALWLGCATDAIWLPSLPGTAASAHRLSSPAAALVPGQQVKAATAPSHRQPAGHSLGQPREGAAAAESLLCHCCLELQTHQDTPAAVGSTSQHLLVPCTDSTGNAGGGRAPRHSWKKLEGPRCPSMWGGCTCWQQCSSSCCPYLAG